MGGMTGMWLGANASQRLNWVVICSASAKFGSLETWSTRIETVRRQGMKPVAAATIERWFTSVFRAKNPSTAANIQKIVESVDPKATSLAAPLFAISIFASNSAKSALPRLSSLERTIPLPLPPTAAFWRTIFPERAMSNSTPRISRTWKMPIASRKKSAAS